VAGEHPDRKKFKKIILPAPEVETFRIDVASIFGAMVDDAIKEVGD
jgi:hypothetical protein